jgi:hypothetical protein
MDAMVTRLETIDGQAVEVKVCPPSRRREHGRIRWRGRKHLSPKPGGRAAARSRGLEG